MKKLLILTMLTIVFIFSSCSSDSAEIPEARVTYKANVKAIIDANCIGCHANPPTNNAPMALVTFQNVKDAFTSRGLIGRVESGSMPPNGELSTAQINALKSWQTAGFPEE